MSGNGINNNHCEEDGGVTERITTCMTYLIGQMERWFDVIFIE